MNLEKGLARNGGTLIREGGRKRMLERVIRIQCTDTSNCQRNKINLKN